MDSDTTKETSVSRSLISMTDEMRKNGVSEFEIMKTVSEHMDQIWRNPDNYLDFQASLPKEMLIDCRAIFPEIKEALSFFQINIGKELKESDDQIKARLDYANNMNEAQIIGHLVIEGSNSLLERWNELKLYEDV